MNKRLAPCPKCLPFVGKVFIDDVWSGGEAWINGKQRNKTPTEGLSPITQKKYPLLSRAIEQGLYHPRCKDVHTTYFEGISTPPDDKFTKEEIKQLEMDYIQEQKQQYAKRQSEKFGRLAECSLDKENKKVNMGKKEHWDDKLKTLKERATYYRVDETENFEDLKKKHLNATEKIFNAPEIKSDIIVTAKENFKEKLKTSNSTNSNHIFNMRMSLEYAEYQENPKLQVPFRYNATTDVIEYNPKALNFELYDLDYVQAHELTHKMDVLMYDSLNDKKFKSAIEICKKRVEDNNDKIQSWFNEGGKYRNNFALSDIISALSKNNVKVPIGHSDLYWEDEENVIREIFANISAIDVLDDVAKSEFESLIKELFEAYEDVVK